MVPCQKFPAAIESPATVDAAINESTGQGNIAIPPLQIVTAVAAIANGGTVYKPYILQQIGGLEGTEATFTARPEVLNTLDYNPGVLETIQEGMCGVITHRDLGTAYIRFYNTDFVRPINYTACGKTGTAQTARYPNAWFVAYAPAEDPEIAVVVMVEQSLEGSQVSAPIVRRILDGYFNEFQQPFPEWWSIGPYVPVEYP